MLKKLCVGVVLNSFSCVASFSNMNFNAMFDNIVLGHVKDKNEAYHESSMVKQTLYNLITLTAYLGLVITSSVSKDISFR